MSERKSMAYRPEQRRADNAGKVIVFIVILVIIAANFLIGK